MCNPVTTRFPEMLLTKGEHEGYEWEVTNNGIGYRCGYVRIPAGHPWHGRDYDDVDASVHGGLTYAEHDADCGKGGDDADWWLGFDCAHAGDAADPSLPGRDGKPLDARLVHHFPGDTIKDTGYAVRECISLIDQARAAA